MQATVPVLLIALLATSCSGGATPSDAGTATADAAPTQDAAPAQDASAPDAAPADAGVPPTCAVVGPQVVQLPTQDGLTLEADLYTTGEVGGPAAVLLHMIPPFNTRRNYPAAFIEALVSRGVSVLNVDRRGAGGDATLARTAYEGPDGKWDAKAAYDFLVAHECAIDAGRMAFIGASNGTTTVLDFAVYADAEDTVTSPAALVMLTGGPYTENNNRVLSRRTVLDPLPIQFVFSTAERDWSATQQNNPAAGWIFEEYDPGAHGTGMFDRRPESIDVVAEFVKTSLEN